MRSYWWKKAVIYEIYCKSFYDTDGDGLGDLNGVYEKLPHLAELGINCIWFTPIYVSPQFDNGYDVADYSDIEPTYGGMTAFKRVLDRAHELGIKVVMDMVLNHSSDKNKWFQESRKSKDNPYRNYYYWREGNDGKEPNNWANYFKTGNCSAWNYDETTGEYYLGLYGQFMPDLNWECKELREDVYRMMRSWLDLGVDGFRLDVITKLKKPAGLPDSTDIEWANGYHYFSCDCQEGLHEIIHDIAKNTWLLPQYDAFGLGEASGIRPDNGIDYLLPENEELDILYHFQIVNRAIAPCKPDYYKQVQKGWTDLLPKGICVTQHLDNHDQPRLISRFGNDSEEYRKKSGKMLAMMTHMMPGTVFVYQGEEIGMINSYHDTIDEYNDRYTVGNYNDGLRKGLSAEEAIKALWEVSRDNARRPMPWNGGKNGGFTEGTPWLALDKHYETINLEKDKESVDSMFKFYQKLIGMRKKYDSMTEGDIEYYAFEDKQIVAFKRECKTDILFFVGNWSNEKVKFTLPPELKWHTFEVVLSNFKDANYKTITREMEPWDAAIYKLKLN